MAGLWTCTVLLMLHSIFIIEMFTKQVVCDSEKSKVIEIHSKEQFDALINDTAVSLVYFYKKGLPGLDTFLKEYTQAAHHLSELAFNFALADCIKLLDIHYCTEDYTEHNVYGFRDGQQKISLPLETVFNLNSIVASALHLAMAAYLPITQTSTEREQVENRCKGNCNIVFGYQFALGTYDHRVFMEVAYSFMGQLMFALTTNTPVTRGLIDELNSEQMLSNTEVNSAIWVIFCHDVKPEENCSSVRYKGSIDTPSIARYINNLPLPKWVDLNTNVEDYQALKENNQFFVYLLYETATKAEVVKRAQELGDIFHGMLALAIVPILKIPPKILEQVQHKISLKSHVLILCIETGIETCEVMSESENAADYLNNKIFHLSPVTNVSSLQESSDHEPVEEELQQDDGVVMGLQRDKRKPSLKMIQQLTEATFLETVTRRDVVGITFYVPWDPVSQVFFLSLDQTTELLSAEDNLIFRVSCADWPVLCDKNNITSYPTVKIFRRNQKPLEYMGLLSGKEFLTTVLLYASSNPVILNSSQEVDMFVRGKWTPFVTGPLPVTILGFFTEDQKIEMNAFSKAAEYLHGQFLFGIFKDDALVKDYVEKFELTFPTIVVFKRNDKYQPHVLFTNEYTPENIIQFVQDSSQPIFPELSALNFITYMQRQKPFVILFDLMSQQSHLLKELGNLAAELKFPELIFCWLPVDTSRNLGTSILFNYTKELVVPAITILDKIKGNIYNYASKEKTIDGVSTWLHEFLHGNLEPSDHLVTEEWKPLNPGIDFLSMMDEDVKGKYIVDQSSKDDQSENSQDKELQDFQNSRIWKHYKQNKTTYMTFKWLAVLTMLWE